MNTITSNRLRISYNIYGKGPVTLLFVHGSFIDQSYWASQVAFFEDKYTVITMDLAGHGQSGTEREHWTVENMADDVIHLCRELQLQRVILIGHSFAGDINLIAATKYPEPFIGFIGIDTLKNAATPLPDQYRDQVAAILESARKDYAGTNEQYARMALLSPETPLWITEKIVAAYRNSYTPMGAEILPQFFEMDTMERLRLPRLGLRLDLVNVTNIPTNTAALAGHTVNGYSLTEIKGTCHYPMLEVPEALNTALEEVIGRIVPA